MENKRSNAREIIEEISNFLDRFSLKTNKLETKDLIRFIEDKWAEADDGKYEIHYACIIIGRMLTEYSSVKDFANLMRWLEMNDKHANSRKHPAYINNYYKGGYCLRCGEEQEALKYLLLCYDENPEYIYTRGRDCIEFFNKHSGKPVVELPEEEEKDDDNYAEQIELKEWKSFFKEDMNGFYFVLGGDMPVKRMSPNHKKGLEYIISNQSEILQSILSELLKQYPSMQNHYGYTESEKQDFMPDVTDIEGFADLLSPIVIYILSVYHDKFPYIGYMFSCSWDGEHGLGVMTFKDRIIEIGGADSSFSDWIARKDLQQQKKQAKQHKN
ncbi:MAG: hypothetical protein LBV72_17290 [Tannerella sp.]|jgi:hypothetical protein|nr:hypothetical protein [Tannerella sp.]